MPDVQLLKGKYAGLQETALRSALTSEGYDLFSWRDPAGAVYSPHSHPHDEYIVVYSGSIEFKIGAARYDVEPGDALILPSNTVHEAENRSKQTVQYFICTK